jgi:hypothetical protein
MIQDDSRQPAAGPHPQPPGAGEIHELKEELASLDKTKKKDAVKKVIAAMTVGKDVSMLFPSVVNCMQTADLELKKLVYLYLINYAKTQPDLAIMAVNTFVKVGQEGSCAGGNQQGFKSLQQQTKGCLAQVAGLGGWSCHLNAMHRQQSTQLSSRRMHATCRPGSPHTVQ